MCGLRAMFNKKKKKKGMIENIDWSFSLGGTEVQFAG
jgi:hypothetical protein